MPSTEQGKHLCQERVLMNGVPDASCWESPRGRLAGAPLAKGFLGGAGITASPLPNLGEITPLTTCSPSPLSELFIHKDNESPAGHQHQHVGPPVWTQAGMPPALMGSCGRSQGAGGSHTYCAAPPREAVVSAGVSSMALSLPAQGLKNQILQLYTW